MEFVWVGQGLDRPFTFLFKLFWPVGLCPVSLESHDMLRFV